MATNKGFIKDQSGNYLLPITRGELVLDVDGNIALTSGHYEAGKNGNTYGLISAVDLAKITGNSGQSLSDIYTKLGLINAGLKVGNTSLNFYSGNTAKTITLAPATNAPIEVVATDGTNGTTVSFGLKAVTVTETNKNSGRISSITADAYGRISEVTYAEIDDSELPTALDGKTLNNAIVGTIKADASKSDGYADNAIMPKSYIDALVSAAKQVALGALTFRGSLSNPTDAISALNNNDNINGYYKVTVGFDLASTYFVSGTVTSGSSLTVKTGDTLIIYKGNQTNPSFVHIPSGDDEATTAVTVKVDNPAGGYTTIVNDHVGAVSLRFNDVFNVTAEGLGGAYITLPQANAGTSGYLSATDYAKFQAYSEKTLTYKNELQTTSPGAYLIGTFEGVAENTIIGKDTISTLSLKETEGDDKTINPVLTFETNTVEDSVQIAVIGGSGIVVNKDDSDIVINANNIVDDSSKNYLEITNGHQFKIKLGNTSGGSVVNGLTDYAEFNTFKTQSIAIHAASTTFELISDSLKSQTIDHTKYMYGSDKLKTAITVTI